MNDDKSELQQFFNITKELRKLLSKQSMKVPLLVELAKSRDAPHECISTYNNLLKSLETLELLEEDVLDSSDKIDNYRELLKKEINESKEGQNDAAQRESSDTTPVGEG